MALPSSPTVLTSGIHTTNGSNTASINPTAGGVVLVLAASAGTPGPAFESGETAVSGCGLTWTTVGWLSVYSGRRAIAAIKGVGSPSEGALTITTFPSGGTTFQETLYGVLQITGQDDTTFSDAAITGTATGTSLTLGDVGTPGAGDAVLSVFANTLATDDNRALTAGITELAHIIGGGNVRSLIVGWDINATPDETPGATQSTSDDWGGLAFIVNVAAGGGGTVPSRLVSPTPLKSLVNGGLLRASVRDVLRYGSRRPGLLPAASY